ncbi:MAG: ERG4/ERG24 family protein [Treponema sp.]|nr:ERG4/ERG24 family protein [Treponema sp.]
MSAQEFALGFFSPWIVCAVATLLHLGLPAIWHKGYARHEGTGKVLEYKLNAHLVLPGCALLWLVLGYIELVPWTWLRDVRWAGAAGAATLGIIFTLAIVLAQPKKSASILADLWRGRLKNPQWKKGPALLDAKIWLCLCGAVMLQLNALSFLAYHWQTFFDAENNALVNPGFLAACVMLTFFVWDYMTFEKFSLYGYGFTTERVGFKLGFGCLAFYPYFYSVALWATAHLPNPGRPQILNVLFVLIFIAGWILSRGANLQKYYFKISPVKKFFGIIPRTIHDEKHSLLINGFWGKSRHINYLGEILMACAIALAAGPGIPAVWLYPLYYVALLFARQAADDKRCAEKYGALWTQYQEKVRYKIIPRIY